MSSSMAPRSVVTKPHPYSGPASMECVNATDITSIYVLDKVNVQLLPPQRLRVVEPLPKKSSLHFHLDHLFKSGRARFVPVEESSFFLDHEYDSDARRSTRRSVRSRRLVKKRVPRPTPSIRSTRSRSSEDPQVTISPVSERSARSEVSGMSFSANTYRSGWTSSLCSDDTYDYLNDPYLPYWRLMIRTPNSYSRLWALVLQTPITDRSFNTLIVQQTQNLPLAFALDHDSTHHHFTAYSPLEVMKCKEEATEMDSSLHAPAAHRVLYNRELLTTILESITECYGLGKGPGLHRLLFVSKSFFHTTADLLWKEMDSFMPFIQSFLPLAGEMPSPEVMDSMVDGSLWERFLLYSSRTGTLTISSETASHGYWISFLLGQHSRPRILFPKLRTLNLRSADIAAITILSTAAPRLSACNIYKSDSSNFVKTAIAALTLNCEQLSTFTTAAELSQGTMDYLARMRGLENVVLGQRNMQKQWNELLRIGGITGLKTLALDYVYHTDYTSDEINLAPTYSPIVDDVLGAAPQTLGLERLLVAGDGITQHKIARAIALPRNLRQLDLIIRPPEAARILLVPNVLRLYLERNPRLEQLRVKYDEGEGRRFSRGEEKTRDFEKIPAYTDCASFLAPLSRSKHLTEIKLDGVPFFDSGLILKITELLPSFPNLKRLTLRLRHFDFIHSRLRHAPTLDLLETVSTCCPNLEWLDVPLTWTTTPRVPSHPSTHRLTHMWIAGGRSVQPVTFQQKVAIARYLMMLFPKLRRLSAKTYRLRRKEPEDLQFDTIKHSLWSSMDSPSEKLTYDSKEREFWEEIETLVHSYQETRRQAIAEMSKALPYHDA